MKCGRECASSNSTTSDKGDKTSMNSAGVLVEKTPLHCNETTEKTTLSLDVAGFQAANLSVEIDDSHILIISGERTNKLGDTFVTRRRFALRDNTYDEDTVSANLNDGVLEVTILKKSVPKSRKVAISVTPVPNAAAASLVPPSGPSSDQKRLVGSANEEAGKSDGSPVVAGTVPEQDQHDGGHDQNPGDSRSSPDHSTNNNPDGAWEHIADHA